MLLLQTGAPLPIAATAGVVLVVSLLVTALWLRYLTR